MARLAKLRDERGAVYIEFLIAFFPLFLLFLAICQLALIAAADAVVRHAAYAAVRAAVVVLEDSPDNFDGAERGSLSDGRPARVRSVDQVLSMLGIGTVSVDTSLTGIAALANHFLPQQGSRMVPLRTAAILPLIPLAPHENALIQTQDSVAQGVASTSERQLGFATQYTRAGTTITVHDSPDSQAYAVEPIGANASVTVRVNYIFHCSIPLVRSMICRSLLSIPRPGPGNEVMLAAAKIAKIANRSARFKLLTATATLPNQGAAFYVRDAQ